MNLTGIKNLIAATLTVDVETLKSTGTGKLAYVDPGRLLANLYTTLVIISGIYTFINLALGGFRYLTSGGDKIHLEEARNKITYSLLGLALVVGAYALGAVVKAVFGVSLIGAIKWPTP